jgi:hypothetical protein
MNILKTFKKMTTVEKAEMMEYIIFEDTVVFNYEHKTLNEGANVAHICINEDRVQLTIHLESNIEKELV